MKSKNNIFNLKLFVILFILIITGIIAVQIFGAARFETVFAEQGEVIDGFWTEALVIRDEKVIKAPVSGRVEFSDIEGDRASYGSKVAEIKHQAKTKNVYNKEA